MHLANDRPLRPASRVEWRSWLASGAALAALWTLPTPADAATFYTCTSTKQRPSATQASGVSGAAKWLFIPTFRVLSTDFPAGSALRTAITFAISELNQGPHALTMRSTFVSSLSATDKTSLGEHTEVLIDDAGCSLGCTNIFQSCSAGIVGAHVTFWSTAKVNWSSGSGVLYQPYGGAPVDARSVALHEFGHAIGIDHTSNRYSIMGDNYRVHHANVSDEISLANVPYVGSDTTVALRSLYGTKSGSKPELSVSHWVYLTAQGAYSAHRFARVYPAGGTTPVPSRGVFLSSCSAVNRDACAYDVSRGQSVDFELTHENNGGAAASSVTVTYKLSTDPTIAANDTTLGSSTFSYSLSNPVLRRHRVTIPTNLTRGQFYYLGVIVDPSNAVAEIREDSLGNAAPPAFTGNATWVPIFIL